MLTVTTLLCSLLSALPARAGDRAADIPVPPGAKRFRISDGPLQVNGHVVHLTGFSSTENPSRLQDWYRKQFGQPMAENRLGKKLVLGKVRGAEYITVQLEPGSSGTQGVIATAKLQDGLEARTRGMSEREHWQARLPSGARLLSHVVSHDADQRAEHLVITSRHTAEANSEYLETLMREHGLMPEQAMKHLRMPSEAAMNRLESQKEHGTLFHFKGAGKEAVASVLSMAGGQNVIVLNIVTKREAPR
jgi:hypothetical protein